MIYRFSSIYLTNFCWIHLKLDLQAYWGYFCRCVKERPQRPKLLGHFVPPNESKFRFSNILLKVFLWIHYNLSSYAHWRCMLSEMSTIWASKAQFVGYFGPQSKLKFWCLVTFSKSFHFHISIASHDHCKYFKMCGEYGPQRSNFWATLVPKISKNSGLCSFSQNFSIGFASVLVYMRIWATFSGVLNIGLRGLISG